LPCGFLYAFVAVAAGTGSAAGGLLVMAAFWTGTLPVMAGLGLIAQRALGPLRRRLPVITASILVVVGLLAVSGVLRPKGMHHHTRAAGTTHVHP
jgi:sulfite exporter TauE/SafE